MNFLTVIVIALQMGAIVLSQTSFVNDIQSPRLQKKDVENKIFIEPEYHGINKYTTETIPSSSIVASSGVVASSSVNYETITGSSTSITSSDTTTPKAAKNRGSNTQTGNISVIGLVVAAMVLFCDYHPIVSL